jgi:hypothetical protein
MKKITPKFLGNIVKGKLKLSGAVYEHLQVWLGSFKTGTEVDLTVKKHTTQRTLPQNAYYFGVVVNILSNYFGYEPEEMHDELKRKFNPVPSKLDPEKVIGGTTTRMSVAEFFTDETSYVNRVRRWAAVEYGIHIPDPTKIEGV